MGDHVYNEAQLEAINADNHKILVSAGAGAGKSGTLTERIIRLIREGKAKLSDMLVITFTKDAASSIRGKISKALRETAEAYADDSNIKEAMVMIPAAHISTIHSFCLDMVRTGSSLLDIDPTSSVVDDAEWDSYFMEAVTDAVDAIAKRTYPKNRKACFGAFKRTVPASLIKGSKQTPSICMRPYDTLMGIPDPFKRLNALIDEITRPDNPWKEEIFHFYKLLARTKQMLLDELEDICPLLPEKYRDDCKADSDLLRTFLKEADDAKNIDDLITAVNAVITNARSFRKSGTMTADEEKAFARYKVVHEMLKNKKYSDSQKQYFTTILASLESVNSCKLTELQAVQTQLRGFAVLLEEVHNCFMAIKKNHRALDFSDQEQYAYQLLTDSEHPEIRMNAQKTYKYIFVDECQDVSAIQHAIIRALDAEDNHTYYVGDIKQSIYRFRHADPMQFLSMRDIYSEAKDAECRKIFFRYNYRSSETIVEAVNKVFSDLLIRDYTEIDYEPGDHLLVGSDKIPPQKNEIILINENKERDPVTGDLIVTPSEAQCAMVAQRINDLIKEGYEYKDIVILLRAGSSQDNGLTVANWLTMAHVPCYYNGKHSFLDTPEISLLVDILKTINNDRQEIPLIATLRSDIFHFSDKDLANIRVHCRGEADSFSDCFNLLAERNSTSFEKRCHDAREYIRTLAIEASEISRCSEVVWNILKGTDYYAVQSAYPDGEIRQKNLDAFYQKALDYEKLGNYKLSDFLSYLESTKQVSGGGADSPIPMRDNDNFVRIMTIHGSKGLEFPVVFVMDMDRNIHHRDKGNEVRINIETETASSRSLGIYLHRKQTKNRISSLIDTYGKEAFSCRSYLMELAEEARMLYVAMTRAMKKLYLVGVTEIEKTSGWYIRNREYRAMNVGSMLDMVMPVALDGDVINAEGQEIHNSLWDIYCVPSRNIASSAISSTSVKVAPAKDETDFDNIWAAVHNSGTQLPTKTAVSYILNHSFEAMEEDAEVPDEESVNGISLSDTMEIPAYMTDSSGTPSGADLGTLTHKLMRLLNFRSYIGIMDPEEAKSLLETEIRSKGSAFSTLQEDTLINQMAKGISRFLVSPEGQKLCENRGLRREQDFVHWINVDGYPLLVQGVIDALYMDDKGAWHIIDYKTDHDTRESVLIEKHAEQLNYYRSAIEKIRREPVASVKIVAVRTGEVIEVPVRTVKYA